MLTRGCTPLEHRPGSWQCRNPGGKCRKFGACLGWRRQVTCHHPRRRSKSNAPELLLIGFILQLRVGLSHVGNTNPTIMGGSAIEDSGSYMEYIIKGSPTSYNSIRPLRTHFSDAKQKSPKHLIL